MYVLGSNSLSKEELLSLWGGEPYTVTTYSICLPIPTVKHPPSFLGQTFGRISSQELLQVSMGKLFQVYEDCHPTLKGKTTTWKVMRAEVYQGSDDCAYEAIVICHCDRVENTKTVRGDNAFKR